VAAADAAAAERARLKARMLRLTAGTNRGFVPMTREHRGAIVTTVEDLEALAPWDAGSAAWTQNGELPEELFGDWKLAWSTAPDVLSLTVIPLVDCGEIRQDIPKQPYRGPDEPLEVFNTVELSPSGAGLLGALPPLAGILGAKAVVKAEAQQRGTGALSIRFVGGNVRPVSGDWPVVSLPTLPSVQLSQSGINLLTTYLDEDMRVARSPLGDLFVLLRC